MPVPPWMKVARGGFTTLAGEIDHQARAGLNALRRQKTDKSTLTAKGSLYVASAATTVDELTVGADGTIPVADSAETLGIAWKGGAVLIEERTPSGVSDTDTFSNIPADYKHLRIVGQVQHDNDSAGDVHRAFGVFFNGDSTVSYTYLVGYNGDTAHAIASSAGTSFAAVGFCGDTTTAFEIFIPDYLGAANAVHTVMGSGMSATAGTPASGAWRRWQGVGRWDLATAITSVSLFVGGNEDFTTACRFSLYGLG